MTTFQFRMPAGIPGALTRVEHATVEPQLFDAANPCPAYGVPVKINGAGKIQPIGAADVVAAVYGLLVRPFPTNAGQEPLGTSTPPQNGGIADVLRRGYMMVLLSSGSVAAVKAGQVYIRIATAGAGKPIGGYEAAAGGTNTLAVTDFFFTGPADANGNIEVEFNI